MSNLDQACPIVSNLVQQKSIFRFFLLIKSKNIFLLDKFGHIWTSLEIFFRLQFKVVNFYSTLKYSAVMLSRHDLNFVSILSIANRMILLLAYRETLFLPKIMAPFILIFDLRLLFEAFQL